MKRLQARFGRSGARVQALQLFRMEVMEMSQTGASSGSAGSGDGPRPRPCPSYLFALGDMLLNLSDPASLSASWSERRRVNDTTRLSAMIVLESWSSMTPEVLGPFGGVEAIGAQATNDNRPPLEVGRLDETLPHLSKMEQAILLIHLEANSDQYNPIPVKNGRKRSGLVEALHRQGYDRASESSAQKIVKKLRDKGLLETRTGAGNGSWLTPYGRSVAQSVKDSR